MSRAHPPSNLGSLSRCAINGDIEVGEGAVQTIQGAPRKVTVLSDRLTHCRVRDLQQNGRAAAR